MPLYYFARSVGVGLLEGLEKFFLLFGAYANPRIFGRIRIDENNRHAWLPFYIGRINRECTFDIVYRSNGPIAPVLD